MCLRSLGALADETRAVQKYMLEMIAERRHALDDTSRHDLFSLLMATLGDGDAPATERELMGMPLAVFT